MPYESTAFRKRGSSICCVDGGGNFDGSRVQITESRRKSVDPFCHRSFVYSLGRRTVFDAIAWGLYAAFLCVFRDC
jgi:hypothetical protein